jgi:AcrR family transcriptional regulator
MPPSATPSTGGSGRYRQRKRTRDLLLATARQMLAEGKLVTVQTVAAETGVSRATIYRYFPSNDDLVVHAALPDSDDPLDEADWPYSPHEVPTDPIERAGRLVRTLGEFAFDREAEMRALLRVSLEPDSRERGLSRQGRTSRHRWIATLIDSLPADVSTADRRRLSAAMNALFGSDAVVWTTDMAGLDRAEAIDVLDWMARTLTASVLNRSSRAATPEPLAAD